MGARGLVRVVEQVGHLGPASTASAQGNAPFRWIDVREAIEPHSVALVAVPIGRVDPCPAQPG